MSKNDDQKTKAQLIEELDDLRRRAATGDRMEADPNNSQESLMRVVETIPSGIILVSPDGRINFANPAARTILRLSDDDMSAQTYFSPSWKITATDGGPFPAEELPVARVLATGRPVYDVEHAIETPDGGRVFLSVNAAPLLDRDGAILSVIASFTDVTEQKRVEKALQYRLQFERLITLISARFINVASESMLEEMNQALQEIGEFTGVDRAYVLLFADDLSEFSAAAEWARGNLPRFAALSQHLPTNNFAWWMERKKRGETFIVGPADEIPAAETEARQMIATLGIKSLLEVPMFSAGRLIGVLGQATVASQRQWPDDHVSLLKLMAEIFANAVTRKNMETALRESEEKHRLVFTGSTEGILVADGETMHFLHANPAICRMLGYSNEEILGLSINDIHPPDELAMVQENFRGLASGLQEVALDIPCRRKDGSIFFAEIRTGLIHLNGRPCVTGFFTDVTLRKRAETERSRLAMVVRHSLELVNLATLDGRMVFLNEAGARMLGLGPGEIEGTNIMQVIPGHLRELVTAELLPALLAGKTWEGDLQYLNLKTGGLTDVHVMCFTIPSEKTGEPLLLANVSLDITERKRAEAALRDNEEKYRALFESAPEGILIIGLDGTVLDTNEYFGAPREAVVGSKFSGLPLLHPEDRQDMERLFQQVLAGGAAERFTVRLLVGPGQMRWLECYTAFLKKDEAPYAIQVISRDITDRKKLEEQLVQAQKMEAVGRLAGGVAHDFNNQLMVILNLSEFVHQTLNPDDPRARQLELIIKAAEQSSALTRQLLAFSRKQVIEPLVININDALAHLERMLSRIIGEDVELKMVLEAQPGIAKIDPTQLEQIIINLAVNARDAMPSGGKLTIETANVHLDRDYTKTHPGIEPGDYLMIGVSDNGPGISPQIVPHVFEPFFTTKDRGKGTGLGLSTVYGIVKQAGGEIQIYSEPDTGTTFKIYLPRADSEIPATAERRAKPGPAPDPADTILVVEDNDAVRETTIMILEDKGYRVIAAESGERALTLFTQDPDPVHLLLTDVVMTGISGKELATKLTSIQPGLKVLYVSGYTDNVIAHHGVLEPGTNFLQKPFSGDALIAKVQQLLSPDPTPEDRPA